MESSQIRAKGHFQDYSEDSDIYQKNQYNHQNEQKSEFDFPTYKTKIYEDQSKLNESNFLKNSRVYDSEKKDNTLKLTNLSVFEDIKKNYQPNNNDSLYSDPKLRELMSDVNALVNRATTQRQQRNPLQNDVMQQQYQIPQQQHSYQNFQENHIREYPSVYKTYGISKQENVQQHNFGRQFGDGALMRHEPQVSNKNFVENDEVRAYLSSLGQRLNIPIPQEELATNQKEIKKEKFKKSSEKIKKTKKKIQDDEESFHDQLNESHQNENQFMPEIKNSKEIQTFTKSEQQQNLQNYDQQLNSDQLPQRAKNIQLAVKNPLGEIQQQSNQQYDLNNQSQISQDSIVLKNLIAQKNDLSGFSMEDNSIIKNIKKQQKRIFDIDTKNNIDESIQQPYEPIIIQQEEITELDSMMAMVNESMQDVQLLLKQKIVDMNPYVEVDQNLDTTQHYGILITELIEGLIDNNSDYNLLLLNTKTLDEYIQHLYGIYGNAFAQGFVQLALKGKKFCNNKMKLLANQNSYQKKIESPQNISRIEFNNTSNVKKLNNSSIKPSQDFATSYKLPFSNNKNTSKSDIDSKTMYTPNKEQRQSSAIKRNIFQPKEPDQNSNRQTKLPTTPQSSHIKPMSGLIKSNLKQKHNQMHQDDNYLEDKDLKKIFFEVAIKVYL